MLFQQQAVRMPITAAPATDELDFLGSRCRVLADGLVEMLEMPAGDMPPLHVHSDADEGFYVIAGRLTLFLPDREIELEAGAFQLAPRGVPHTYRIGAEGAHVLVLSYPAGFERFVQAVADLSEVDPATLTATAAEHGIQILGPPGTLPPA